MSDIGNLVFLALAFALGMVIYTSFVVAMYFLFMRESPEETIDVTPDTQSADQATAEMEEINIDEM